MFTQYGCVLALFLFCLRGGKAMAKIRDMLKFKKKKRNDPISFEEYLERAKERQRKQPPDKPAEVLSIEQLHRLMGDTGSRQFLKDKGNRRK